MRRGQCDHGRIRIAQTIRNLCSDCTVWTQKLCMRGQTVGDFGGCFRLAYAATFKVFAQYIHNTLRQSKAAVAFQFIHHVGNGGSIPIIGIEHSAFKI